MTLMELAKQLGVSVRTVYRRAEKQGLNIADLRDSDGQLKPEAFQTLSALFDSVNHDMTHHDCTQDTPIISQNDTRVVELETELAFLKGKFEGLERENKLLREMLTKADQTAAEWKAQAERAQQIQVMQMNLLPEKAGAWQRLKHLFTGKSAE